MPGSASPLLWVQAATLLNHLLLVEPDADLAALVDRRVRDVATVERHSQFTTARTQLGPQRFDFIVTNLRLGAYNGLHLVYLAAGSQTPPRAIVYTDTHDPVIAREIRRAGAFYETRPCLAETLAAYLRGVLPPRDRRTAPERRILFRGGRRCVDQPHLFTRAHA